MVGIIVSINRKDFVAAAATPSLVGNNSSSNGSNNERSPETSRASPAYNADHITTNTTLTTTTTTRITTEPEQKRESKVQRDFRIRSKKRIVEIAKNCKSEDLVQAACIYASEAVNRYSSLNNISWKFEKIIALPKTENIYVDYCIYNYTQRKSYQFRFEVPRKSFIDKVVEANIEPLYYGIFLFLSKKLRMMETYALYKYYFG